MNNKDLLSQEEIDALLRQGSQDEASTTPASDLIDHAMYVRDYLTEFEQDTIGEIGNITFGTAATTLSTLLRQKVDITTPTVSVVRRDEIADDVPLPHVTIRVEYTDGFEGANVLAIRTDDAKIIADLMLGGDGTNVADELNELHLSAVAEAMNQMMGSASTSMSTLFNKFVNISPPAVEVIDFTGFSMESLFPNDTILLKVSFRLIVGTLIDSHIMQLLPVTFAKTLISALTGGMMDAPVDSAPSSTQSQRSLQREDVVAPHAPVQQPIVDALPNRNDGIPYAPNPAATSNHMPEYAGPGGSGNMPGNTGYMPPYGQPMYPSNPYQGYGGYPPNQAASAYGAYATERPKVMSEPKNVQPAQFSPLEGNMHSYASMGNLDLLLDIPLSVTVELGRTRKLIREILELAPGAIVELDKLAGEPVDILINNKLIAKGEVVVIDENFGVRVTDIISPADRIRKLQ
ncbi:flagellar motor switch phosphatase FliY [Fodinisporobacter ferrooxydans]|uniref:Flagellar motor switch phosphatase FliY n=1 Tax=Fodinisporobacter ferrooxydans TaxID=2901836 RepID=A0ABY4CFR6_9BACL|nr:flagellar motor switch phosphatase FliY [Alicyclobacillaceae bacterium MYW30-H2]